MINWSISLAMLLTFVTWHKSNQQSPDHQSDVHPNEQPTRVENIL